jgi:diguanylate cyclase (GGDEF)-like protein/PAS domain S-box-containing protein
VRVLVADDDEAGRYLLESVLRAQGYEVVCAVDGLDALEKARETRPDLIITDVLMPRMDGYKLCVRLKNDPDICAVPILVYTASFGDAADQRFAMSLGVDSFMLKPQEPGKLLAEVERLLSPDGSTVGTAGPRIDEPGMLKEYGERISHKLYQKLLELERTNADLNSAMLRLNVEIDAKSRLVKDLSLAVEKERQAQEALLVSQERYAAAVRGANDGIWDWDLESDAFVASARFRDLLGLRDDEPLVSAEQWLSRVSPDDAERLRFEIDLHLRGLTPHFESEYQVARADGMPRWMQSRGQALRREDGTPYRMAGSLSDITERKRQEEQLLRNALYDGLTGLPNRSLFMDRMTFLETRRQRHDDYNFAVLSVDLDRFKTVNESLGHAAGDELLLEVSRRVLGCARTGDTVARFSGDEFVMLLDDVKDPLDAEHLAQEIQDAIAAPFMIAGTEMYSSASIGIAMTGGVPRDPEEILRDAETAMYRAKESGRARAEVFDSSMHARAVSTLQTEAELRRAIERGELEPYYQPVVSIATGMIVSCEALARWNHPERGLLGPYEFVPIAEQTGLIVPMGIVVMRAACARNREWQESGHAPIKMSVNISARHFGEPDLLESIREVLRETGLAPEYLLVEVTESVVMADPARAAVTLDALHAMGVSLAVDDFGTGYSSLSYLKRFPFHMLKIDRSFVMDIPRDTDDMTIVEAVVGLAHSLKLQVTAEGVETPEQLAFLRTLGCDNMQGFLVSRPVPAAEFEALLKKGRVLE